MVNPFTGENGKAIEQPLPDDWRIKRLVREYFEENDRGYPAKIAKHWNLRWGEVSDALKQLEGEGFLTSTAGHYRRIEPNLNQPER
ncbi:MAG: hypothetical protein KME13_17845 [Myxacorys californica WJT36-NPBG1]|jgi:DNA-binding MarR family transcriptional regulator|nr:hypothetical protein [Myxacorys californica WJT36-NPBG1]